MKILNFRTISTLVGPKDLPQQYIGRPTKWGNPFVIGRDGTRTEVIYKYEVYIRNNPELLANLPELKGYDLVCYCAPLPCHGDVLIELMKEHKLI